MRWDMYSRVTGLRLCTGGLFEKYKNKDLDKETRNIARVHNDLVPFKDLLEDEQKKDNVKLSPDAIKAIESVISGSRK